MNLKAYKSFIIFYSQDSRGRYMVRVLLWIGFKICYLFKWINDGLIKCVEYWIHVWTSVEKGSIENHITNWKRGKD
jgi:hypothetical protein